MSYDEKDEKELLPKVKGGLLASTRALLKAKHARKGNRAERRAADRRQRKGTRQ